MGIFTNIGKLFGKGGDEAAEVVAKQGGDDAAIVIAKNLGEEAAQVGGKATIRSGDETLAAVVGDAGEQARNAMDGLLPQVDEAATTIDFGAPKVEAPTPKAPESTAPTQAATPQPQVDTRNPVTPAQRTAEANAELAEIKLAREKLALQKEMDAAAPPPNPHTTAGQTAGGGAAGDLAANISQVKAQFKLDDGGQIDITRYITRKDRKIIRDALKESKDKPGALDDAKQSVADSVGSRILVDAKSHANNLGLDWSNISQSFSVRNSLFKWKSTGVDINTGVIEKELDRTVDPNLIARVFTETRRSDFVAARTAVSIAVPPLAPLIRTSGRLVDKLDPFVAENWRNLAIALGIFTGTGALAELAEADRNEDEGKTGPDFAFNTQDALDKGIPFWRGNKEQPNSGWQLIPEALEPLSSGNAFSILRNLKDLGIEDDSKKPVMQTPSAIEAEFKAAQENLGKLRDSAEVPIDPATKIANEFKAAQEELKKQ